MNNEPHMYLFGTYAGMYTDFRNDEDGLQYLGVRRSVAFQATDVKGDHWVVEPAIAVEAANEARRDFGNEGYDTRWHVDAGGQRPVSGTQISFKSPEHGDWQLVDRDDQGNYLLPRSEFPDVADQARRGIVDRVIGPAADPGSMTFDLDQSWVPAPTRGAVEAQRALPADSPAHAPQSHYPF